MQNVLLIVLCVLLVLAVIGIWGLFVMMAVVREDSKMLHATAKQLSDTSESLLESLVKKNETNDVIILQQNQIIKLLNSFEDKQESSAKDKKKTSLLH